MQSVYNRQINTDAVRVLIETIILTVFIFFKALQNLSTLLPQHTNPDPNSDLNHVLLKWPQTTVTRQNRVVPAFKGFGSVERFRSRRAFKEDKRAVEVIIFICTSTGISVYLTIVH